MNLSELMARMVSGSQQWYDGDTMVVDRSGMGEGRREEDETSKLYLSDTIDFDQLLPFPVPGDGNCLLHALHTTIAGPQTSTTVEEMRNRMAHEMVENEPFYRFYLNMSDLEWSSSVSDAATEGKYLGSEHIWALSNVLRRPIVLLDSKSFVSDFGEGESATTATYLPTRVPLSVSVPPPLLVAWASVEHRHYVALLPIARENEEYPRVKIPQVAYERSIPPGRKIEDYFNYRLATGSASAILEVQLGEKKEEMKVKLRASSDVVANAIHICQNMRFSRSRIPIISDFIRALSVAHSVPCIMSDSSFRTLQECRRIGIFPHSSLQLPPTSSFSDIGPRFQSILLQMPKFQNEMKEDVKEALLKLVSLKDLQNTINSSSQISSFSQIVSDILPIFPKPPILLGFIHGLLSECPIEHIYPIVRECQLPKVLVDMIKAETDVRTMTMLFRCLSTLLNAPIYGCISFPIIHHRLLKKKLYDLFSSYPILHFPSLSSFLRNYASFISYTQLIPDIVRDDHLDFILSFLERCIDTMKDSGSKDSGSKDSGTKENATNDSSKNHSATNHSKNDPATGTREFSSDSGKNDSFPSLSLSSPPPDPKLFLAIEDSLISIGNIIMALPSSAARVHERISVFLSLLSPFASSFSSGPSLLSDLSKLLQQRFEPIVLSRTASLLRGD